MSGTGVWTVQATENDMRVRVHGACGLQDFLDTGVPAAIHKNQPVRSFDSECKLRQLDGARNLGNGVPQKNPWSDFCAFVDKDKMTSIAEFARAYVFRVGSIEIAQFCAQGRLGAEEGRKNFCAAKTVGAVGGGVNVDVRIDLEEIFESGSMVGVTMRDNSKVEFAEVHVEDSDVVLEDFGVVPRVEEDALAIVPDESGEPPVASKSRIGAEGVVENSDAVGREGGTC